MFSAALEYMYRNIAKPSNSDYIILLQQNIQTTIVFEVKGGYICRHKNSLCIVLKLVEI